MIHHERKTEMATEQELASRIAELNKQYWEKGIADITDTAYDSLVEELRAMNPEHPLIKKLEAPVVLSSGKVRHSVPMLSLAKAYSLQEIMDWATSCELSLDTELLVQPKYDGISADWSSGVLSTRGDGDVGENITDKLPIVKTVNRDGVSDLYTSADFRGELLMSQDVFKNRFQPNITSKTGTTYKTVRNCVAGIMGSVDSSDLLGKMERHGAFLHLVDYRTYEIRVLLKNLQACWKDIEEHFVKFSLDQYPCDGIVIKVKDEVVFSKLGTTAHHPKGAVAFKFQNQSKMTRIVDVEWGAGKKVLTPTAVLEPVVLGGVTIDHATLHNYKNVVDNDIQIGDEVCLERSGDVIPYVASTTPGDTRKPIELSSCPFCDWPVHMEGVDLVCLNPNCPEVRVQRLVASAAAFDIDTLADKTIRKLISQFDVKTMYDIFMLTRDDLAKLDGFGSKSAENLHNNLMAARTIEDWKVLASFNIEGIGKTLSKAILAKHTLPELVCLCEQAMMDIDGLGSVRAHLIKQFFNKEYNYVTDLLTVLTLKETKQEPLKELRPSVCLTGKMQQKRSYYVQLAFKHGIPVTENVTSSCSLLVTAEPDRVSAKITKAKKLGIPIVTIDEWLTTLNEGV